MTFRLSIRASYLALAASALAATGTTAMAQTPDQAAETVEEESGGFAGQDIVVTAQRRPERLQDIPLTVTAFNAETIKSLNLNDAISVSKYVPSMISQHNAGLATANSYFLRGLGNTQSAATFDPPVGTYVDDIYVARQNANNYAFFDTERVEVLRGPQGTLFGRNTTGGAVAIIMRKPKDEVGAKFEMSAGSFDRVTAKTSIDLPISSTILTKWSAFYVKDDGYLKNITTGETLNGERSYGFRGDLRLLPTDDLTIDLSGEYTSNTGTYFGVRTLPTPSSRFGTTTTPVFYEAATNMRQTSCKGDPVTTLLTTGDGLCLNSENYAASANITYSPDAGTLQAIVGYRKQDQGYINNYSSGTVNKFAGFILADKIDNSQHSGELKWNSELFDGKLKYVAGIFYLKEINDLSTATFSGGTTAYNLTADVRFHQEVETAAAYAQGDYEIVPDLIATLGARYTWEVKNLDFFRSDRFPGFGYDSAAVIATGVPLRQTQSRVTPRIALSYKFDPNVLVFASATNGFKSGGWNGTNSNPALVLPFRPEVTWSYETGFKSELFDRKLRLNGNVYLAITKDLQVTSGIIIPPLTTVSQLARNAGKLQTYGFEWEAAFSPNRYFNIFVNGSINRGKYLSTVQTPGVPANLQIQTSTVPVRVPDFQIATGATFKVPVDALGGDLGITGAFRHNSPYFVAALNTAAAPTENFVDLTATYDNEDGKWGASFGVTNLTKQETITANFISLFPGDPRRFTGRFWFNF
ncbi:TonB-dependent receptor [Sphingobium boeckii]|uniref:Iron complex outermembrane receptor protein n=1 Tax=Sphingobium boeckii TaxID=1082345 RepID=A0A7W9AL57_9SPHN|nr:TonB-dependent receptor [Sphingobium boeckii]MBB5687700.1 iron complex outermembrane receptor protein [Sphingobium boeckii]